MPLIKPPEGRGPMELVRAGIFKCIPAKRAACGMLWRGEGRRLFFELVRGPVDESMQAEELVEQCRKVCVPTFKPDPKEELWGYFRDAQLSATPIWKKGW
jgi:hypothetical protein